MIFSCGLTSDEWEKVHKEWHSFFPLFPRTLKVENGRYICAWLQPLERRAKGVFYYEGRWVDWEYRLPLPQSGEGK